VIWADRVAIVWLIIFATFDAWAKINMTQSGIDDKFFVAIGVFVGIPWLFLRAVDWIAGGPARRKGQVIGYIQEDRQASPRWR
jgi:hypothetical protein